MIIILGASGYIGNFLFNKFREENIKVIGTYSKHPRPGLISFNLDGPMDFEKIKVKAGEKNYMIISASVHARPDECKLNWEESYQTNVVKIKEVIDYCFDHDIIPIYLSTDNVFDGVKGNYSEEDNTNPINCYGRIKWMVENYLISSQKPFVIIRMGKVFGTKMGDDTYFTGLIQEMHEKKTVKCATDQIFTPCFVDDLYIALKFIMEKEYAGTFHLASTEPITRYQAAQAIKRIFELDGVTIIPSTIDSFNLPDYRPKLIDLNISKWKKMSGFEEKAMEYYLGMIDYGSRNRVKN